MLNLFEDWISKTKEKETKELELASSIISHSLFLLLLLSLFSSYIMQTEHVAEFVEPKL